MNREALRNIRRPAVAGQFYPRDPSELRGLVGLLLAGAPPPDGPAPKALIVPHAAYIYSGPIAATAYVRLAPGRGAIRRVVLLGPSHRAAFPGLAASSAAAFETPLGPVAVEGAAWEGLPSSEVATLDAAHYREHALEVQLPFLQTVLGEFRCVPLLAGETAAGTISEVLDHLWGGPETCIVVSSDLSHYHSAQDCRMLDQETARAIEGLDAEAISPGAACGRLPICGLLLAARRHGLRARALDLRHSGDTGGPRHQVVGYGAFAFEAAG